MVRGFADRVKRGCQGICRGAPGKERHKSARDANKLEYSAHFRAFGPGLPPFGSSRWAFAVRLNRYGSCAEVVLRFRDIGFTNVTQKAGMSRAATCVMLACLLQAQVAIDREPDILGVVVFLAVVFPPANRAECKGTRRIEGFETTARAAKTSPCDALQSSHLHPLEDGRELGDAGLHEKADSIISRASLSKV